MRSWRKPCNAIALALVALTGCATTPPRPSDAYVSFTDHAGNEISLSEPPEKVAVLFSSFAEVWITAGGQVDITVGESVERGFVGEDVILVDGGAGKTIDTEALLAARPDFVICSADIEAQADCASFLQKAGIPAAQFRVESFDDYLSMLSTCTRITGNADAYTLYGEALQEEIDALIAQKPLSGKDILFIRAGSSARSVKAKNSDDNFACAMLRDLGAHNIADDAPVLLDGLSMEIILEADPDYIFFTAMGDETASQSFVFSMLREDAWAALTAVKEQNYSYLPKDMFHYKPNRRWAEAYRYLADLL